MSVTIKQIKNFLDNSSIEYFYHGDENFEVTGFCPIKNIKKGCITWIRDSKNFNCSHSNSLSNVLIVAQKIPENFTELYNIITCENPRVIYFEILNNFFKTPRKTGVASTAIIKTQDIGSKIYIGHNTYIGSCVKIGERVTIMNNVSIECPTVIGDDCIIGTGTVIGAAGFGYYEINGVPKKIPDLGGVKIGNRVEIGANVCISAGTLSDTIISDDVKIDALSYVAHNCKIGDRSLIISSSLGGSCEIGEDVYLAPKSVIKDNIVIGKGSFIGIGAVVNKNIEPNQLVVGTYGRIIKNGLRYKAPFQK